MGGRSGKVRPRGFSTIQGPRNTATRYEHRLLFGIPTLGVVRIEWHNALNGLVIPTNFSNSLNTPIGFRTDDAQNVLVKEALEQRFDWLFLLEDDVIPPPDLLLRLRPYIQSERYPMVSGLYSVKGNRAEPMIYRGRGNGPFLDWKPGTKVMADGVPTGCLLIHTRLLQSVWDTSERYTVRANGGALPLNRVFETPRVAMKTKDGGFRKLMGTSDLFFCDRVRKENHLELAGWPRLAKKDYPFLVDTSIRCGHIDRTTGFIHE